MDVDAGGVSWSADLRTAGEAARVLEEAGYAGVWSTLADKQQSGINLTQENVAEAQNAASAVGDDRIQQKAGQRVNPESFTHGSAAQRKQWFTTGYQSGDLSACNTFK